MTLVFYISLLLLLVPIQVTVLMYVSPWGIQPDLCLVSACLIGFLDGKGKGGGMGLALGFIQDLFSGGAGIVNLITKGLAGFLSGVVATTLSNTTAPAIFLPTFFLSSISGLISLMSARPQMDWFLLIHELRMILLPQGLFDATFAFGILWLMTKWRLVTPSVEPSSIH